MDPSRFTLIAIFFVFIVGVPRATSWESRQSERQDGYDLQRGPVFYEAYYPDDPNLSSIEHHEQHPMDPRTSRLLSNAATALEKTHQSIYDPPNNPPIEERENPTEFNRNNYNPVDFSTKYFRGFGNGPINSAIRRYSTDRAYEVARQLKIFVEGLERDSPPENDPTPGIWKYPGNDYETAVSGREFYGGREKTYAPITDERTVAGENFYSDDKFDDYVNAILSAVRNKAMDIAKERFTNAPSRSDDGEENVRVSRRQRFVESENPTDLHSRPETKPSPPEKSDTDFSDPSSDRRNRFSDVTKNSNGNERLEIFDTRKIERKIPIFRADFSPVENIFEPRPQVISYVFSPTRTSTETHPSYPETASSTSSDDSIGKKIKSNVVEKSDGLGIASIEVSEIPRHRIRHHHGEKPRRRDHRRTTDKSQR